MTLVNEIDCPWCLRRHTPRYMCDPLVKLVTEIRRRSEEGDMPAIELETPIPAEQLGIGADGDRMVGRWTVQAATGEVAGVIRPGVSFTGTDVHGRRLPNWIYLGSDDNLAGLAALVGDMTSLAIRTAARMRGGR